MAIDFLLRVWYKSTPVRYLIVGGWNFAFGYGVFAALYWALNGILPDWIITAVATILGITMSFVTHKWLTYRSSGCWWREYVRFYVVYGAQSLLNVGLIVVFVTYLKFNAYIAQLAITLGLTVVSFWAHKLYSFKKGKQD